MQFSTIITAVIMAAASANALPEVAARQTPARIFVKANLFKGAGCNIGPDPPTFNVTSLGCTPFPARHNSANITNIATGCTAVLYRTTKCVNDGLTITLKPTDVPHCEQIDPALGSVNVTCS